MKITLITTLLLAGMFIIAGCTTRPEDSQNQTPNNQEQQDCAGEGQTFSAVYEDYPKTCCEGLTEWNSGFDTRISVADICYETGMLAGSPTGTCINCGNGICEEKENPCNCPEDCTGKGKSTYATAEDFCNNQTWQQNCQDPNMQDYDLCKLC